VKIRLGAIDWKAIVRASKRERERERERCREAEVMLICLGLTIGVEEAPIANAHLLLETILLYKLSLCSASTTKDVSTVTAMVLQHNNQIARARERERH
jgi:hypothetical protein